MPCESLKINTRIEAHFLSDMQIQNVFSAASKSPILAVNSHASKQNIYDLDERCVSARNSKHEIPSDMPRKYM